MAPGGRPGRSRPDWGAVFFDIKFGSGTLGSGSGAQDFKVLGLASGVRAVKVRVPWRRAAVCPWPAGLGMIGLLDGRGGRQAGRLRYVGGGSK